MPKYSFFHRSLSVVLIICMLQSCSYYKVRTASFDKKSTSEVIEDNSSNYYAVHLGDNLWELKSPTFTGETVSGTLSEMSPQAARYYRKAVESEKYNVPKDEMHYVSQLHIHVDQFNKSEGKVSFNTSDITKIDVMNKNKALSTFSRVGTSLLIAGGGMGVLLLIACNCPHTYTYDGSAYHYNNTLFTGATSENLERNDYKTMPDYNPESDNYNIIIKNEDNELQYTNLLELIVVNHNDDTDVSLDKSGNVHALKNQIEPTSIIDDEGKDLKNILAYNDDLGHLFDSSGEPGFKNVYATFDKPNDVSNTKLVLKAKNSKWSGFVYKEFSKLLGNYHDNWVKKNHARTPEEAQKRLKEAGIPMLVSIKNGDEWIDVETIDLVGEVNYNSLVVPIDPSLLTEENIEVRIQSGFMFWDLDYVNIDFTPKTELDVQYLSPTSASGTNNTDDKLSLAKDDDLYMEHLSTGDSTKISFTGIESQSSLNRTIFLHSKGYYLSQDEYKGRMQLKELVKVKEEAGMSKLSERLFNELFLNYALNYK